LVALVVAAEQCALAKAKKAYEEHSADSENLKAGIVVLTGFSFT
jgi:hypothetical protein